MMRQRERRQLFDEGQMRLIRDNERKEVNFSMKYKKQRTTKIIQEVTKYRYKGSNTLK